MWTTLFEVRCWNMYANTKWIRSLNTRTTIVATSFEWSLFSLYHASWKKVRLTCNLFLRHLIRMAVHQHLFHTFLCMDSSSENFLAFSAHIATFWKVKHGFLRHSACLLYAVCKLLVRGDTKAALIELFLLCCLSLPPFTFHLSPFIYQYFLVQYIFEPDAIPPKPIPWVWISGQAVLHICLPIVLGATPILVVMYDERSPFRHAQSCPYLSH